MIEPRPNNNRNTSYHTSYNLSTTLAVNFVVKNLIQHETITLFDEESRSKFSVILSLQSLALINPDKDGNGHIYLHLIVIILHLDNLLVKVHPVVLARSNLFTSFSRIANLPRSSLLPKCQSIRRNLYAVNHYIITQHLIEISRKCLYLMLLLTCKAS